MEEKAWTTKPNIMEARWSLTSGMCGGIRDRLKFVRACAPPLLPSLNRRLPGTTKVYSQREALDCRNNCSARGWLLFLALVCGNRLRF